VVALQHDLHVWSQRIHVAFFTVSVATIGANLLSIPAARNSLSVASDTASRGVSRAPVRRPRTCSQNARAKREEKRKYRNGRWRQPAVDSGRCLQSRNDVGKSTPHMQSTTTTTTTTLLLLVSYYVSSAVCCLRICCVV